MTEAAEEAAAFARLHPVIQHHVVNSLGWPGLRPLQAAAVAPVLAGDDCLLLAPTAGGKTEAAVLPLLTRMESEQWGGLAVLYVCPLKALLNNLEPRLATYAGWLGRSAYVRHGDTTAGQRRRQTIDRPSILLTTPESLEAMLVSTLLDSRHMFGDVRAVVIDEVHAFAGDDRGWHLLALLERLNELTGRHIQRIGLSATVGNPDALLGWLQGAASSGNRAVVAPETDLPTAERVLERLRVALETEMGKRGWPITASIGALEVRAPAPSIDEVVKAADRLMYRAKEKGKNCVVTAQFEELTPG